MTQGDRVRNLREALGMTQDELANKVGYKSRSSINKLESDPNRQIPTDKIRIFAKVLNSSVPYLMGWEDEKAPEKMANMLADHKYIDMIIKFDKLSDKHKEIILDMIEMYIKKENDYKSFP